jgi:hypothetical protein
MTRYITVLLAMLALALGGGVATASAGSLLPGQQQDATQTQSVSNDTSQTNKALAVSANVLSGNNTQIGAGNTAGSPQVSSEANPQQENENATGQSATQTGGQDQRTQSQGCCHSPSGSQSQSSDQTQTVDNSTTQENKAAAVSLNVLSGNNTQVGYGNQAGSPSVSSEANPQQENQNATWQDAKQSGSQDQQSDGQGSSGPQSQDLDQTQTVDNSTTQENKAAAVSLNVLSGNNTQVGYGNQAGSPRVSSEANPSQKNENATWQNAEQSGSQKQQSSGGGCASDCHSGPPPCHSGCNPPPPPRCDSGCNPPPPPPCNSCGPHKPSCNSDCKQDRKRCDDGKDGKDDGKSGQKQQLHQTQTVTNDTQQKNKAFALSGNFLSGNNTQLGFFNCAGSPYVSSQANPSQENENATWQRAKQSGSQEQAA